MNKKLVIPIILLPLIGFGIIIFLFKNKPSSTISPAGEDKITTSKPENFDFDWKEWQDPAGFAFEYPSDIQIDKHPEDTTNYANLDLFLSGREGGINITVNDSDYTNIEEWLENDELAKDKNALDTTIASASAKRVSLSDGSELAAMIDPDVVIYLITANPRGERYWQEVYKHIIDSFRLIPLEGESQADFSNWMEGFETGNVDIVEPVEVIE